MVAKVAVSQSEHQAVGKIIETFAAELWNQRKEFSKTRRGRRPKERESGVGRDGEIHVEVITPIGASVRKENVRVRCARWRKRRAIQVGWQHRRVSRAEPWHQDHFRSRVSCDHLRAIESVGLRTEVGGTRRVEHVHAHVISVWPNSEMWGVIESRTPDRCQVVIIPGVAPSGVARCRNRDALVSQSASKLTDQPTIGDLVIQHDRITLTGGLSAAAETGPDRLDTIRAENGSAGRLAKDLVALVHDLDVL